MADMVEIYLTRVRATIHEQMNVAKDSIVNGSCTDFEQYKYITGQFSALSDLETIMVQEYNKLVQETYGNEGEADVEEDPH